MPSAGGAAHGMRRQFCGKHKMCEYVLSGRMTVSGACGDNRFHIPAIRVWSVLPFDDKIEGGWGLAPMFTRALLAQPVPACAF